MPLYDYKCKECDYLFEVEQRITDGMLTSCPKCNGKIRRLISSAGIIFKGSGFHVNDYKSNSKPQSTTSNSNAPKENKAGTKQETKQEKKSSPTAGSREKPTGSKNS